MKRFLIILPTFISIISIAQVFGQGEFKVHKNGLIYSEKTMEKLEIIVDSLNLKYKTCDFNKTFYSNPQTVGYLVTVKSRVNQAKKDMKRGMPIDSFRRKYRLAKIEENVIIVQFRYTNYKKKKIVEVSEIGLNKRYAFSIEKPDNSKFDNRKFKGTWLYDYSNYSEERIKAFYFPDEFKSVPLKRKYAEQLVYADCLIDTTSTKFIENATNARPDVPKLWRTMSTKKQEEILHDLRSVRVYGMCSMDDAPRRHAVNIAMLSAETANWEVFLKAHLDVMNDRFDRASDGSYAWARRKTYIKELEEIDINVHDLLMGIIIRVENPAENHYYGSTRRLGRAMAESNKKDVFETSLLEMLQDTELDHYNRAIAYFSLSSFIRNLEKPEDQLSSKKRLKEALKNCSPVYNEKIEVKLETPKK